MSNVLSPLRALIGLPDAGGAGAPESVASRLNWLRAGVLGANDGIVSVAAVVIGVAGATTSVHPILVAGAAALIGGALSMALGEYVSVSSQRDAVRARIARGDTSVDEGDDVSPAHAALASLVAFFVGGLLPFLCAVLVPIPPRVPVTFAAVLLALALTGWLGARFGGAPPVRATVRVVIGGAIALGITFGLGALLGTSVGI